MADILEDPGDGDWWAVDLGHEKTSEDHFVKVGVGSPGKKPVDLDQHLEVRVVGLGLLAVVSRLLVFKIDTFTYPELDIFSPY